MALIDELRSRAEYKCELCGGTSRLEVYAVPPSDESAAQSVLLCPTCLAQMAAESELDRHHWRCLTEAMWSEVPAVKVVAWRMLNRLASDEPYARDALDMMYLDDETMAWAQAEDTATGGETANSGHKDCNGVSLSAGDTVTLIKDLNVKGAGFTAKRGTAVRNISLVPDNPEQIEGRVNSQQIVILTQFVKKTG